MLLRLPALARRPAGSRKFQPVKVNFSVEEQLRWNPASSTCRALSGGRHDANGEWRSNKGSSSWDKPRKEPERHGRETTRNRVRGRISSGNEQEGSQVSDYDSFLPEEFYNETRPRLGEIPDRSRKSYDQRYARNGNDAHRRRSHSSFDNRRGTSRGKREGYESYDSGPSSRQSNWHLGPAKSKGSRSHNRGWSDEENGRGYYRERDNQFGSGHRSGGAYRGRDSSTFDGGYDDFHGGPYGDQSKPYRGQGRGHFEDHRINSYKKTNFHKNIEPHSQRESSYRAPSIGNARRGFEYLGSNHSIKAALLSGSRGPDAKLFVQNDSENSVIDDSVIKAALSRNPTLKMRFVSRTSLDKKHDQHRGAVLECRTLELPRTTAEDSQWQDALAASTNSKGTYPTIVLLDQVQDVHNFGAMLRSACFLGVDHIIMSASGCAPPSESVSRVSAGALELLASSGRLLELKGSSEDFVTKLNCLGWRTVVTAVATSEDQQEPEFAQSKPQATELAAAAAAAVESTDTLIISATATAVASSEDQQDPEAPSSTILTPSQAEPQAAAAAAAEVAEVAEVECTELAESAEFAGSTQTLVISATAKDDKPFLKLSELSSSIGPTILVLGNEEKGCRKQVSAACTYGITIPSAMGTYSVESQVVDSLNVSAAAAILMSRLMSPLEPN